MTAIDPSAPAAILFALAATYVVAFQLLLAGGAPWGHLTLGGRWTGALPPGIRLLALVQALIAVAMAGVVLDRGGVVILDWPGWAYYATLVLCALSVVGNAATPSRPERRLGLPVAGLMLATAGLTAWT